MKALILLLLAATQISFVQAHEHIDEGLFKHQKLSENLYMLSGKGGNLALSVGADGLLLVDDDYSDVSEQTRKAISAIDDSEVKFVINTHWHFDHTGANESLGNSGSVIVAHDNVRERLLSGGLIEAFDATIAPAAKAALPVLTYADSINFHWNNETIEVIHPVAAAHTDGDSVIFFKEHNVVHMGDLYFNKLYPFIDSSSGGSMQGVIEGVSQIIERIDDNTRVIPGHGPLSNKQELVTYRDMLTVIHQKMSILKAEGKTKKEAIDSKPTADYDAAWGQGFLNADTWVGIIYQAL